MEDNFFEQEEADGQFSVSLQELINAFELEKVYYPDSGEDILVYSSDVARPGLQLSAEYYGFFDNKRIQIIGMAEHSYLDTLTGPQRTICLEKLFQTGVPAFIVTRSLPVHPEVVEAAKKFKTPVLHTGLSTSDFMSALIARLNVALAPRITRHGVLVEVYGEGVLLLGDSGVGKSETAIELVKRGHRLVADDAVEIKRVSAISVIGSAPEIIRHFIEIRGIGIIDVKEIFGMGSIKDTEKIDLIIHVEHWVAGKNYDRLGMENNYTDILGIKIPSITVPVRPGRNLAVIVEVAAMNNRQKKMGYNAAEALTDRISRQMESQMGQS